MLRPAQSARRVEVVVVSSWLFVVEGFSSRQKPRMPFLGSESESFLSCSTTQIEGEGSSTIAMQVARQNIISGTSIAKDTR